MAINGFPLLTSVIDEKYLWVVIIVKILFLICPANMIVKYFMPKYKKNAEQDELKNGRMIGILERLLILCFLYFNQVSSIAIVLTCKSISRFKQLDDKDFAERYLIGTLISTLITIIVYII